MMSTASKCVENCIRAKLQKRFNPKVLQLVNESYMHNVPKDSETHFKVVIVSDEFEGMPLIKVQDLEDLFKRIVTEPDKKPNVSETPFG